MKFLFSCLGSAWLAFAASPSFAESSSAEPVTVYPRPQASSQVTVIKRDARENVIAVRQVDLAEAIAMASKLVPGAISKNDFDIKSLTISYN